LNGKLYVQPYYMYNGFAFNLSTFFTLSFRCLIMISGQGFLLPKWNKYKCRQDSELELKEGHKPD